MFVGFKDYRISLTDNTLSYTVDTKIHHVEHWGSLLENLKDEVSGGKQEGVTSEDLASAIKESDRYKETCSYGKNCQKNYVDFKWNQSMSFDILGVDKNKAYNIKTKANGDLPFDFNGSGNIDLIVARVNARSKQASKNKSSKKEKAPETSAFDLLDDFDLEMCKASFDGTKFRIPDPHLTFARKTTMEPNRRAVVESYVKHFKVPEDEYMEPIPASRLVSATIKAVRKDGTFHIQMFIISFECTSKLFCSTTTSFLLVMLNTHKVPNAPFYKLVDVAAGLPDTYTGAMFGRGSLYDPMVEAKHGLPIQVSDAVDSDFL